VVISTFFGSENPYLPVAQSFTRQSPKFSDKKLKFMELILNAAQRAHGSNLFQTVTAGIVVARRYWFVAEGAGRRGPPGPGRLNALEKLTSVGSGMLLDAVQSGWTAALHLDGAGLARVRLSEQAPAAAAHREVFHWPIWPIAPPFIGWPLVHPDPDVD
jgi:hypothetical protein